MVPTLIRTALAACLVAFVIGCSPATLETEYGHIHGVVGDQSINGVSVLARMFEQSGNTVLARGRLTPRLGELTDTFIWFDCEFGPPQPDAMGWLDDWLAEEGGRTLIYVGRDFDAAVAYWNKFLPNANPTQKLLIRKWLSEYEAEQARQRTATTFPVENGWFKLDDVAPRREPREFTGQWSDSVDGSKAEISLGTRLAPLEDESKSCQTLLTAGDDPIVVRQQIETYDDTPSQRILVTNGSFLLDGALVNHEHRKLAAQLVDAAGPPGRVVFLETRFGLPMDVLYEDPVTRMPTGLEFFTAWPLGPILLHFAAAGVIFCFWRWPQLGKQIEPPGDPVADFGQHVSALGELLALTKDRSFAEDRLAGYRKGNPNLQPSGNRVA